LHSTASSHYLARFIEYFEKNIKRRVSDGVTLHPVSHSIDIDSWQDVRYDIFFSISGIWIESKLTGVKPLGECSECSVFDVRKDELALLCLDGVATERRSEVLRIMHKKFFVSDKRYRLRSNLDGEVSEIDGLEPANVM